MGNGDGGAMAASTTRLKTKVSTILSAILSWPTFAILVLILFWSPLHRLGDMLPRMLEQSDTVKIGNVSIELRRNIATLQAQASPEVRDALAGMNADDAVMIVENNLTGDVTFIGDPGDDLPKWKKLVRLGLVRELSPAELRKRDEEEHDKPNSRTYGVTPTARYDKVFKFLTKVTFEIADAAPPTDKK